MRKDEFPIVKSYCKDKVVEELEKIKAEIGAKVFEIQPTSDKYFGGVDDVMDIVSNIIDNHTSFIRTGEQVKNMILEILDRHIKEI